ncbi:MAG: VTT domain-containing protein, partial [Planctomycetota bacterium]
MAALACLALVSASGCSARSKWVRNNPLVRRLFYPPVVQMGRGLGEDTAGEAFDHSDYGRILAQFVDEDGFVDYGALRVREARLEAYIRQVATAPVERLSRSEQLALLINAYNAFTLKLMLEHPGAGS